MIDWGVFRTVVDDLLDQYPDIPEVVGLVGGELQAAHAAGWIHLILESARRMLGAMEREIETAFSLMDSFFLRTEMESFRQLLRHVELADDGIEGFRNCGVDQRAAHDIADLLANHLFEDDPEQQVHIRHDDERAFWAEWYVWVEDLTRTLQEEVGTAWTNGLEQFRVELEILFPVLEMVLSADGRVTVPGREELQIISEQLNRYMAQDEDQVAPGHDELQPLFFRVQSFSK